MQGHERLRQGEQRPSQGCDDTRLAHFREHILHASRELGHSRVRPRVGPSHTELRRDVIFLTTSRSTSAGKSGKATLSRTLYRRSSQNSSSWQQSEEASLTSRDSETWKTKMHTLTTTLPQPRVATCPSLSLRVCRTRHKCALLSLPVPLRRLLSLKGTDYESEGRRFESCRARPSFPAFCRRNPETKESR